MSIFGGVVIIAPIIGPVLGGWITDNYSWQWIFFINIPIGIIVLLLSVSMEKVLQLILVFYIICLLEQ